MILALLDNNVLLSQHWGSTKLEARQVALCLASQISQRQPRMVTNSGLKPRKRWQMFNQINKQQEVNNSGARVCTPV